MPAHLWIHIARFGPPGIAAALLYFGKAPLECHTNLGTGVEQCSGLFGQTDWTEAGALAAAVIAFAAVALVSLVLTGRAFPTED
jgi:hypothetical protein